MNSHLLSLITAAAGAWRLLSLLAAAAVAGRLLLLLTAGAHRAATTQSRCTPILDTLQCRHLSSSHGYRVRLPVLAWRPARLVLNLAVVVLLSLLPSSQLPLWLFEVEKHDQWAGETTSHRARL